MATTLINHLTLLVHHIIVFQQALTNTEVVFLHLLLSTLNRLVNHWVLNHLAFLESEFVHNGRNAVRSKEAHQLILKRYIEHRGTWVSLTSCTSTQLTVHTTALMTLRTNNGKTTCCFHFIGKLNIGTTTCHVGSNSNDRTLTCLCHNVCFLLVQLSVEDIVLYLAHLQHLGKHFRDFHRSSTHEHWSSRSYHALNLLNNSLILLTIRLIHTVVHIISCNRTIRRNLNHIELVDVPELTCFRNGCTRHTRELVIHTEVVLQGDGSKSLCGSFYLHALLGFHSLMKSITPATSLHDTTCLLIHNLHLTINHHIVVILHEHRVSLQQLLHGVHTFRLHSIICHQFVLLGKALLLITNRIVEFRQLPCDIRQHEELVVLHNVGNELVTLISHFHRLQLLIHYEVQWFRSLRHPAVVVLHVDFLRLEETCLDAVFRKELDESLVLWHGLICTEQCKESSFNFLLVLAVDLLTCSCQIFCCQLALSLYQLLNNRTILIVHLNLSLRDWTRDDEWSSSIINQHGIDLIDNRKVVRTLHEFLRTHRHVITQIVETKFIVRTEGNICLISLPTCI